MDKNKTIVNILEVTILKVCVLSMWIYALVYPIFPLPNMRTPITAWLFGAFFGLGFTMFLPWILSPIIKFSCAHSPKFKQMFDKYFESDE